jgi:hypothetical protein
VQFNIQNCFAVVCASVTFDDFWRVSIRDNGVFDFYPDTMRTLSLVMPPLLLCAILTACGGGGGSSASAPSAPTPPVAPAPPPPAPAPTLTLSSPTLRTIAGGSAIPLTATLSSGGAVHWQLAAGAPGTLSADNGGAVRYVPPAGALTAPATVSVTASGDGASASMSLAVTPDPGAPGLYQMAWRTETDLTMLAPMDVAADLAGNVYVLLYVANQSPSRRGGPNLVKIAPDGAITKLIGPTWFGQPSAPGNAYLLDFTSGFVIDRAGDILISTGSIFYEGGEILKITPGGAMSVLAGAGRVAANVTGTMTDGAGIAATFKHPTIVGIDIDDNVYVLDKDNTPRKVTPAGVVMTLAALPAGLNADMNGNTYSSDTTSQKLMRTGPDGVATVETSVPYCSNYTPAPPLACLSGYGYRIVPVGGASYVLLTDAGVRRLVLQH